MERLFRRDFDSLAEIFALTEEFFAAAGIDPEQLYTVNLAVEELFTNMVKFNPDGDEHISLQLQHADRAVRVRLCDRRVEPFDVTVPRLVDRNAPVEQRETGGLGLYLVQQMVDTLDYVHRDGVTTVTFTKNLG
ncbi:MAG TPA: ATP-binding protein [Gammaproteobacteria bacterium]|nr:ATP-binding protein [Gammaproteobacteria bacterium]HRP86691.1 ATP-binding protein [Gammaproteobacteria bacterium]